MKVVIGRGALGVALGVVAFGFMAAAKAAEAAPLPKLAVRRSPEAADCPDATALAGLVERQMKRPALDPSGTGEGDAAIEVEELRWAEGYSATVKAGGRLRQISDPGPTCAGLAEGLAITLAILLDSDEAPAPPVPAPATGPAPAETSMSPSASAPPVPPPQPAPPPTKREAKTGLSVFAGVGETVGLIGPLDFAIQGEVTLRVLKILTIGAGIIGLPGRTIDFPPGNVDVYLVTGALRVCADVLDLSRAGSSDGLRGALCAIGAAGGLHGRGNGYAYNEAGLQSWGALGVGAVAEGPIWGRIGWSARLSLLFPVTTDTFTVDYSPRSDPVFETSRAGVIVALGPRVSIW